MGMIIAPLALQAACLAGQWWALLPCGLLIYWWAPRDGWSWLVGIQLALAGTEWAFISAWAMRTYPELRLPIGLIWILAALLIAGAGILSRRRAD
jgi:hypothetical protein